MTPERKQWWDSLPRREKMLREQIWETKGTISKSKFALRRGRLTDDDKKWVISRIKKEKVVLTALKHELDCTTAATFTGSYEGAVAIYRCEKCGGTFENFAQSNCCWCGRKIKRWR
jgi:rubrerythrin|nr:MAG TPA: DNA-directed RNA polymerase II subunit [Caudoviricetes sp.]